MLSAQFWVGTSVTLGAAAVMGLSLGNYATSPQASAQAAITTIGASPDDRSLDDSGVEEAHFTADKGPGVIHCTGCGPTLADRRWKADMAELDPAEPIATDYDVPPDDYAMEAAVEPPAPVYPLPPKVTRFASGDRPPPPVAMTREGQDATPPPQILLPTASESILPQ